VIEFKFVFEFICLVAFQKNSTTTFPFSFNLLPFLARFALAQSLEVPYRALNSYPQPLANPSPACFAICLGRCLEPAVAPSSSLA
jgi:hypothetical protein